MPRRIGLLLLLAGCPAEPDDHADDLHGAPCAGFGLTFSGARYADDYYFHESEHWAGEASNSDPKPLALGGKQTIIANTVTFGNEPFTARVSSPVLAIAMESPKLPSTTLVGREEGTGDLCIFDSSDELRDGTRIAVRAVEAALAVPGAIGYGSGEPSDRGYPYDEWKLFTGKRRQIAVALLGDDDWRLVDHSLAISVSSDGSALATTALAWDAVAVDIERPVRLDINATLANGDVWPAGRLDVVDRVDKIAAGTGDELDAIPIDRWGVQKCFVALLDGAQVLGAPWEFATTAQMELGVEGLSHPPNCALMKPVAVGTGTLTARIGDVALEVAFEVVPTGS